jgi:hypothetical protein
MKTVKWLVLRVVLAAIIFLLIFQPEILGISLSRNHPFPIGTVISWIGIVTLSLLFYLFFPLNTKSVTEKYIKDTLLFNVFCPLS